MASFDPLSTHTPFMQRCCQLAQRAAGYTAPNPLVGSVIVQQGQIVGEGFHSRAGESHAEVFALRAAGDQAQGATLYVNLEPCNHHGRTPPCTEAIIQAQVSRVVIGMADPNPEASGGIERLRAAGIEVMVGIEEAACRQLNEAFIHRIQHHWPFGILKYAMTLDGKIATATGHSAWVTGQAARQRVHQLRGVCDAVIVGGNTVRQDNPQLTSHGECDRNPLRVVMSRRLELPKAAHLWQVDTAPTLVFTQPNSSRDFQKVLRQRGVEVVTLTELTPATVMAHLYERGLLSVLWECGGTLAAEAIRQGAVQKVWAFIAPKLIGGTTAPGPVGELGLTQMTAALPLSQVSFSSVGSDICVEGYLVPTPAATQSKAQPKLPLEELGA
ncbi:bifunctional diaminohydroxyphosphoribosylaminopyrimidine deaminase/5-amino-6-(5-phosphoribosylamino)uracil reductase RibD [Romeria aff. gracilis LEGE 07310]|uniref:Riboflavin biosynthesis protein RibD n=1 Tax=Vasconcelosia minhoensis LEGE 07310 TaxID=915328 RepID=A0A8J7A8Y6_9CYAN|nr:bifunctional diaminohydroxyphosphoribosylaminopyrimidine deaminase/5-amino-6-(5-phosphoribosylamino)uracil reductase RibD [Romeria gracilis]MBE9076211.1 bifunctional diaminohydroxyphosphoribosylaminopyrimidine deaminase/5-amino-6-(5-phosphoribosylamino)uracil reductase RibD [Romeria aff. gracilis LEGE 07310]